MHKVSMRREGGLLIRTRVSRWLSVQMRCIVYRQIVAVVRTLCESYTCGYLSLRLVGACVV